MKVMRVFEHERVRIGENRKGVVFTEAHFSALAKLNERHHNKFFTMLHRGIQFSSEVGVVQVPGLTLEILPKVDQKPGENYTLWRDVLIDMLVECKWIHPTSVGLASLYLKRGAILDVYIAAFLEAVEHLLHQGLVKQYHPVEGNIHYWKGRVHFPRQLRNHLIHQEKVYSVHQVYDELHPFNQILGQALRIIPKLTREHTLHTHARQLDSQFPTLETLKITPDTFSQIRYNRNSSRYRDALNSAKLLLCNFIPDIQFGTYPSFILLFDMDYLFEAFIYGQLKKVAHHHGIQVYKQMSTAFWDTKKIRPDIVVYHKKSETKYVIDTKWKKLRSHQPATADLRQMYVYNQYFGAQKGLLLYPAVYPLSIKNEAFEPPENIEKGVSQTENRCILGFIDILDNHGKLSRKIGTQVLQMLISEA
jgi:5-methylcytosine-specific restriction enzyme subunit McrC